MITVNDIREKEFGSQKHGYNEDQVDEFLDEISDQMEELIKENRSLLSQLDEAKAAAAAAGAQAASAQAEVAAAAPVQEVPQQAAPAGQPALDEPSYFKNLESTLRETLLSAQRIADNTVAEARTKAKEMVSSAEDQAKQLLSSANEKAEQISKDATSAAANAKLEFENFKKSHADFKDRAVRMIKEQMAALKLDEEEIIEKAEDKPVADDEAK